MNFLIKYDSIRKNNNYTVMLYDTVKKEKFSGGDTNFISETEEKINKDTQRNINFNEINNLFFKIKHSVIKSITCVVMLSINYSDDCLDYVIYINESDKILHKKFCSYEEIKAFVNENYE